MVLEKVDKGHSELVIFYRNGLFLKVFILLSFLSHYKSASVDIPDFNRGIVFEIFS